MNARFKDPEEDYSSLIRNITNEEIDFFWKNGWVFLADYVDDDLANEAREHYKAWLKLPYDEWPEDPEDQTKFNAAVDRMLQPQIQFNIRLDDPWMNNFLCQRQFGKAVWDILSHEINTVPKIQMFSDTLHVKQPIASGKTADLLWHQDYPSLSIDRAEAIQTWIALAPLTPEMGTMRHLSGSHHEWPHGLHQQAGETIEQAYPELFKKYPMCEARSYNSGDAVLHHCLTYHGSKGNETNRIRWGMSCYRITSRCIYTGQALSHTNDQGLELFKPLPPDHPRFPIVYP